MTVIFRVVMAWLAVGVSWTSMFWPAMAGTGERVSQ
jgi:hypothetical protein